MKVAHHNSLNDKGSGATGIVGALIIMALVVLVSISIYNRFVVKNKVLECTNLGGECVKGTCGFPAQVPALSDKAAGCDKSELCCINITRSKPIDPMCMNAEGTAPLPIGTECDDNMYCDAAQVCVDKCEFCSKNVNVLQYKGLVDSICAGISDNDKEKFGKGDLYSCSCTQAECNLNDGKKCVEGSVGTSPSRYCIQSDVNAADYACCTKG